MGALAMISSRRVGSSGAVGKTVWIESPPPLLPPQKLAQPHTLGELRGKLLQILRKDLLTIQIRITIFLSFRIETDPSMLGQRQHRQNHQSRSFSPSYLASKGPPPPPLPPRLHSPPANGHPNSNGTNIARHEQAYARR